MQKKKVVIIGAGFAGLSAACFMAQAGYDITVLEKHATPGGRARQFSEQGFTFDMGPSWYWMPDVFERFFNQFGKTVADFYQLQRLDPSYRVYWSDGSMDIPANYSELKNCFEQLESGAGKQLDLFLKEAAYKYEVGIKKLVFKPGLSLAEFIDIDLLKGLFRLDVFSSMKTHVAKYFKHPKLIELMEFPVLFLGALPQNTPALYSLMNYADIKGGTWYPHKGMYQIIQGIYDLAISLGVTFKFNHEVKKITVLNGIAKSVEAVQLENKQETKVSFNADIVIGGADYHHIETQVLDPQYRTYAAAYWEKRVMAPSCLLYYIGLNKKINGIQHHSLFFDTDFNVHGSEIYTSKEWPSNPLFYVSATSVTDDTVAPHGCENLFLLIPVAAGLEGDTDLLRESYLEKMMLRMEKHFNQSISDAIMYKKSFAPSNFISEYHSFKGNAYGLANTLLQTAVLKPSCRSKKVKNLFFVGQLTVPGPGVPPSLISGEVVSREIMEIFKEN